MLYKTKGIVLQLTDYNDKYSIVKIYTENFGMVSYILPKTKGKNRKFSKSMFHTMAIVDLEVEHSNLREIQKIKEARTSVPLTMILSDPLKIAICLFISEFLMKVIREVQANESLFEYISESLKRLNDCQSGTSNFHIGFMIGISRFLGFYPDNTNYRRGMRFDLLNGIFIEPASRGTEILDEKDSATLFLLTRMNDRNMHKFKFSGKNRSEIIKKILRYYRIHLYNFPELKSFEVLEKIFE